MNTSSPWLTIERGSAPLIISLPHTGIDLPAPFDAGLCSHWLARKDADWHIETLYAFAKAMGATLVHTAISRTVIDVNRDPSGQSLYPGQATTELCPTTSFDGEPLYQEGFAPDAASIALRRQLYFDPYHAALQEEIRRLRAVHPTVVLYDCHSIRSVIPRLFEGVLPHLNLGTNSGASCAPELAQAVMQCAAQSPFTHVMNGRFKGGYITRHFGVPTEGVHALQMEMACRTYLDEPLGPVDAQTWPPPYNATYAHPSVQVVERVLGLCLDFAAAPERLRS